MRCQTLLKDDDQAFGNAMDLRGPGSYERLVDWYHACREVLWRRLGLERTFELPEHMAHRFPLVAGILSCVPPGGQLYNAQKPKAMLFGVLWWSSVAFAILTLKAPWSNVFLLAVLLAWCAVWADAYVTSARINGQNVRFRHGIAVVFGIMAVVGASVTGLQFAGANVLPLVRIFSGLGDCIHAGDILLVNRFSYTFSNPQYGDIIRFEPTRFTAERPGRLMSDGYSIHCSDYFQRVVGLPGDRIQQKAGVTYRNGRQLSDEESPLDGKLIPDMELVVPAGHVYAPITRIPGEVLAGFLVSALGGVPPTSVSQPGYAFKNVEAASTPSFDRIFGRAVAVCHPPERRQFY